MNNFSKNLDDDSVVIFTHIPKTAGTSLRHIIQYQFQPNNVFEFYRFKNKVLNGIEKYNTLSEAQKKSIKFVSGHVGFGLHEFLQRPFKYITVLRNPVKRVVSYYNYLLRTKSILVKGKTLEDFAKTYGGVHNSMACYLSGVTLRAQLNDPNINVNKLRFDEETLVSAKKNLEQHYKIFGLVERFDETSLLLKKELGWNVPPFQVSRNVSKSGSIVPKIPNETLKLIQNLNELDIELYEYAENLFDSLIEQRKDYFDREIKENSLSRENHSIASKLYFKTRSSLKRMQYKVHEKLF